MSHHHRSSSENQSNHSASRRKNIRWTIVSVLAALGLILFIARPSGTAKNPDSYDGDGGRLTASEESFGFGTVSMKNGLVTHTVKIKNTGTAPLIVTKLYSSCMCTTATLTTEKGSAGPFGMPGHAAIPTLNMALGTGEEADVAVTFDPNAHGPAGVGFINRIVYVESQQNPALELKFTATVTP